MHNRANLIGLTGIAENAEGERIGSARVGKDEIGDYLSLMREDYDKLSFAGPIYDIVHHAFGIPKSILENPTKMEKEVVVYKPWNMTLRQMLQTVGSELFRHNVDPDFWVKRIAMALDQLQRPVVITDVRMPNEADLIRSRGGVIIHVHRKIEDGKVRPHESETQVEILPEDLHIYNGGSLQDLFKSVDNAILSLR